MPEDLLGKYLTGEATPHERFRAEKWINTNDANRQHYAQFKRIRAAHQLRDTNHIAHNEEAWQRLQNLINKNHGAHIDKPVYKFKARWIQLLVSVALIGLMGYIIRTRLYSNQMVTIASGPDVITETLPDGTIVILNANSKLTFPARFTSNKRTVTLTGEACFKIIPYENTPLGINTKGTIITATGATVNVKANNGKTEITLNNGQVKVSAHGREILLNHGERLISDERHTGLIKTPNNANTPAWWLGTY